MPGNEIKEMEGQNPTGLRSRQENNETNYRADPLFSRKIPLEIQQNFSPMNT